MASPGMQSKIDTLPLEDLRAFSRKQMSMLKQLKLKMDSVNKEKLSIQEKFNESVSLQKRTEEEIQCLKQKAQTLEDTLRESSSNSKQSEQMEFEYEELKLKFEEQNEKMDKFRDMFKERLDTAMEEKEQLRGELQDLIDSKDSRIAELESDLFNEDKENSFTELEEECTKLHGIVKDITEEKEQLQSKLNELASVEEANSALKSQIAALESSQLSQSEHRQDDMNKVLFENEALKEKMATFRAEIKNSEEDLRCAQENILSLEKALADVKSQAASSIDAMNDLQNSENRSSELESRIASLTSELKDAQAALENEKSSSMSISAEADKLRAENVEKTTELDYAEARLTKLIHKNKELGEENIKAENKNSDFEAKIRDLETSRAAERSHFDEKERVLLSEISELKSKVDSQQEMIESSQSSLDNENRDFESKIRDLEATGAAERARFEEKELALSSEISELKSQLTTRECSHSSGDNKISEDQCEKITDLESLLQRSAEELAFLKEKVVRLDELEKTEKKAVELQETNKKLKQLALKNKKELEEMKKKLSAEKVSREEAIKKLKESSSKASSATSSFQAENDRLQDEVDRLEAQVQSLNNHLAEIQEENSRNVEAIHAKETISRELERLTQKLKEKEARLDEALEREVQLDAQIVQEKRARQEEKNILVERLTKAEKACEIEKTKRALSAKELEDTKEDFKTQRLINMEMKDYERSVNELKKTVESAKEEAESFKKDNQQLNDLLDQVRQRANAAEEALESAEERVEKYRSTIEASNQELSELREKEMHTRTEVMQSSSTTEQLRGQLEDIKLQISTKDAELDDLRFKNDQSEKKLAREKSALEATINEKLDELNRLNTDHDNLTKEFEQYKVRVHSVLKQQRQTSSDPAQLEQAKQALIAAHDQIKRLNTQQQESKSQSEVVRLEVDKWRHLAETTQIQLKDLQSSFSDKEKLLIDRANRTEAEVLEAKTKALTLESEITRIQEEHKKAIDDAQLKERNEYGLKLSLAERRAAQAESELFKLRQSTKAQEESDLERRSSLAVDRSPKIDPLRTERSDPIGAERDDDRSDVMSLEQIIGAPYSMSQRSESIRQQESTQNDQIKKLILKLEHANSLLAESEATNSRLEDQSSILKTEIRRLEKNQERESNIHNLEYLKNIILKFMTIAPGSERTGLIPVLDTMLQLEPSEKEKLIELAGLEAEANQASWGSYLPRWGGL